VQDGGACDSLPDMVVLAARFALFADITVHGAALASLAVRFIGQRVNTAGVDPAIVEVEQRADSEGKVNRFVGPSYGVERLHIVGCDLGRIVVHLVDKPEQHFFLFLQSGVFQIAEYAPD
jgi:hypothetical protein